MENLVQAIRAMERNSVRLTIGGKADTRTGASRFGGVPDVPADFLWPVFETATYDDDEVRPRPLAFLAQFDCQALAFCDKDELLPHEGVLSFFYELGSQRWGYDSADDGCARVFWFPDRSALHPAEVPESLEEAYRRPALGIAMAAEPSLPGMEDFLTPTGNWDGADAYYQALGIDTDTLEDENRSCLLGWPDTIQGNMTVECELVGRGVYMGGDRPIPQGALEEARRTSLENWQLLFQLDTVENNGFELMFGDCGRVYFYIRKEDLAARRFDRVWLVLQCG